MPSPTAFPRRARGKSDPRGDISSRRRTVTGPGVRLRRAKAVIPTMAFSTPGPLHGMNLAPPPHAPVPHLTEVSR